jgi:hypothetical protein
VGRSFRVGFNVRWFRFNVKNPVFSFPIWTKETITSKQLWSTSPPTSTKRTITSKERV